MIRIENNLFSSNNVCYCTWTITKCHQLIYRICSIFEHTDQSSDATKQDEQTNIFTTLLKWLLFVIALPPILNFGALQNERQQLLKENTTLFDIGFGQKLYMSCKGKGNQCIKVFIYKIFNLHNLL